MNVDVFTSILKVYKKFESHPMNVTSTLLQNGIKNNEILYVKGSYFAKRGLRQKDLHQMINPLEWDQYKPGVKAKNDGVNLMGFC